MNIMDKVAVTVPGNPPTTQYVEVTVYVYVVSVKADGTRSTDRVGAITSPSGTISYTPDRCESFELWALRTDNAAEIQTLNWKLRTGVILGHPAGSSPVVYISGN